MNPQSDWWYWLLLLPLAVACISWTVTKEELFREWRQYCQKRCCQQYPLLLCKFFYIFTCEYCFSHYVAAVAVLMSGFRLLNEGWLGFLFAWLGVVWVANVYLTIYGLLRTMLRWARARADAMERGVNSSPA